MSIKMKSLIDERNGDFPVLPLCRVLKVAPPCLLTPPLGSSSIIPLHIMTIENDPAFVRAISSWKQLPVISRLYCAIDCFVFESIYDGKRVAVKVKKYPRQRLAHGGREAQLMFTHPNVIELKDYRSFEFEDGDCGEILVLEWMDITIEQERVQRKASNRPWGELELIAFLLQIISALLAAQLQEISHRDIKPENILNFQFRYKLGDFGLSRKLLEGLQRATVLGTTTYMSPLLRQARENRARTVDHNPFKSDVYSLGLTILAMARLEPVDSPQVSTLEADVSAAVSALPYSKSLTQLLTEMLTFDESSRPDFPKLNERIRQLCAEWVRLLEAGFEPRQEGAFVYRVERLGDPRTGPADRVNPASASGGGFGVDEVRHESE